MLVLTRHVCAQRHGTATYRWLVDSAREDDGDDEAVDGRGLAEDDRDQVPAPHARRLDGDSHQTGSGGPDAPRRPDDRQAKRESDARVRKEVPKPREVR